MLVPGIFEPALLQDLRAHVEFRTWKKIPGFTLIEMLVVLMVMGLCLGLVGVISRPDDRALLRLEAERLAQLLDFAATEAQLTGNAIAWTAETSTSTSTSAYRFWRLGDDALWTQIRDSDSLRARDLPQDVAVVALRVENMRPQGAMRLEFSPYGAALAFTVALSLGAERYVVAGSPTGDVRALPEEENSNGTPARR